MRMSHDHETEGLFLHQQLLGPLGLPRRGSVELALVYRVVPEKRAQRIDQPESQVRVQHTVDRSSGWMLDESMDQPGLPAGLGQTITVNSRNLAATHFERGPERLETKSYVVLPKLTAPSIVISSDHDDRHDPAQMGQGSSDVEPAAWNDARIGKPEIEEVAVDQETIAELRYGLQKCQEGRLDCGRGHAEVGVRYNNEGLAEHGAKMKGPSRHGNHGTAKVSVPRVISRHPKRLQPHEADMATEPPSISETLVRVNYSETDQMGVVYHARYLVWLDIARTEHLRHCGMSYRELEATGLRLAVSEVSIRYRQPARFDDVVRIRCWVREVASRRVDFGYAVEHAEQDRLLATASTGLIALDSGMSLTRVPERVQAALHPIADPVRL
jgi:acyl-CoA thioester hydrolase